MSQQRSADAVPVLARLVQYSRDLLEAESVDLMRQHMVVNLNQLLVVDRALLVDTAKYQVIATDSGAALGANTELHSTIKQLLKQHAAEPINSSAVADVLPESLQKENGGTALLWYPVTASHGLWLEKWGGRQWQEAELKLLEHTKPYLRTALEKNFKREVSPLRHLRWALPTLLVATMFIPVKDSVTAFTQVVATEPTHVYAPLDGIIQSVEVTPGQSVLKSQPLLKYDDRVMQQALEEALREVGVAQAELVRLQAAAYQDAEARSRLPVQKLELKKVQARYSHLKQQVERGFVLGSAAGIVVMSDALQGRSVQVGQRLLTIADPNHTELDLYVPVADVGAFVQGSDVLVRLDADPLQSLKAKVVHVAHDIVVADNDVPSVKIKARWADKVVKKRALPGQRGVARIYGERTFLGLKLFRKPLQSVFDWFGI